MLPLYFRGIQLETDSAAATLPLIHGWRSVWVCEQVSVSDLATVVGSLIAEKAQITTFNFLSTSGCVSFPARFCLGCPLSVFASERSWLGCPLSLFASERSWLGICKSWLSSDSYVNFAALSTLQSAVSVADIMAPKHTLQSVTRPNPCEGPAITVWLWLSTELCDRNVVCLLLTRILFDVPLLERTQAIIWPTVVRLIAKNVYTERTTHVGALFAHGVCTHHDCPSLDELISSFLPP
jgi:hypothetical protein